MGLEPTTTRLSSSALPTELARQLDDIALVSKGDGEGKGGAGTKVRAEVIRARNRMKVRARARVRARVRAKVRVGEGHKGLRRMFKVNKREK